MRFRTVDIARSINDFIKDINHTKNEFESAVKFGVGQFANEALNDVRNHVSAVHGRRLANTWRKRVYPEGEASTGAAALIWTKAPQIISLFEKGGVVRAKNKRYMAIPTPAAYRRVGLGTGRGGRTLTYRLTPAIWKQKGFPPLQFVERPGKNPLLISRLYQSPSGKSFRTTPFSRGDRIEADVVMFILVPYAQHKKSLSTIATVEARVGSIPDLINSRFGQRTGR